MLIAAMFRCILFRFVEMAGAGSGARGIMIRQILIKGYRALKYVRVNPGPFQVIVGPNASGKTTFLDSINLLRDILNSGIEASVHGTDKIPIRAVDPRDISWMRQGGDVEIALTAALPDRVVEVLEDKYRYCRYEIAIETADRLRLKFESLWLLEHEYQVSARGTGPEKLFPMPEEPPKTILHTKTTTPAKWRKVLSKLPEKGSDHYRSETTNWSSTFRFGPLESTLQHLPPDEEKFPAATWFHRYLKEGIQRIALNAEMMRVASKAGSSQSFLPDGSNLPRVVHNLESKRPDVFRQWISHLRTALPDLDNIRTVERPEDRSRYLIVRYTTGLEAPSWVVSDGTLRLLALTLLAYSNEESRLFLIEEPENGIHPQAIETLYQSLVAMDEGQVFCATHSPVMLSLTSKDQLLCFSKYVNGEIAVINGNEHPRLREWQNITMLGDLLAVGVLS